MDTVVNASAGGASGLWLICVIINVLLASSKNRSIIIWGLLAAFFNIFAVIILLIMPSVPRRY